MYVRVNFFVYPSISHPNNIRLSFLLHIVNVFFRHLTVLSIVATSDSHLCLMLFTVVYDFLAKLWGQSRLKIVIVIFQIHFICSSFSKLYSIYNSFNYWYLYLKITIPLPPLPPAGLAS